MTNTVRTTTTKRVPMDYMRKSSLAVGVLFILTFLTSIVGVISYGPVLSDPTYVTGAGADGRVFFGAFLELFLIITNIGCAVVLFPLLKRVNEGLALAYVAARIVECTFILVGILSVLAIVTLRQTATAADAGSLLIIGKALHAIHDWTFLLGPGFADGIGTGLILGYLMYKSGLVSSRMALFGVIGGPMLAVSGGGDGGESNSPSRTLRQGPTTSVSDDLSSNGRSPIGRLPAGPVTFPCGLCYGLRDATPQRIPAE